MPDPEPRERRLTPPDAFKSDIDAQKRRLIGRDAICQIAAICARIEERASPAPFLRPDETSSDITCASRNGSIGGLVTCAKRCLQ